MGPEGALGIPNRDGDVKKMLRRLANIKTPGLTADKNRNRFQAPDSPFGGCGSIGCGRVGIANRGFQRANILVPGSFGFASCGKLAVCRSELGLGSRLALCRLFCRVLFLCLCSAANCLIQLCLCLSKGIFSNRK